MAKNAPTHPGLTLFTETGARKYLTAQERGAFLEAVARLESPTDRTFCETIFWTGCRPAEALSLTALHIDIADALIVVPSVKKRGENKGRHFRSIPVPRAFIKRLDRTHGLQALQKLKTGGQFQRLWTMSRTTAWKRMRAVMALAGITGPHACAKGLRHSYGVHAAMCNIPETRIKKWLGHASLRTTEIYLDLASPEDRKLARRMWSAGHDL
ncbi:MAG: tyrosine-type recombinase/integrase [Alphaproteobacteria bacterium]|nr:tyrosine-type recombinase/integrase [Alphaproteobacteria bacterium]